MVNETFRFGEVRRVYISKGNGKERPLFQDQLVQEVMRNILQTVFEPIFSEHSHGFRPGRSQHTALRYIRKSFKGSSWIIEGDIEKFFDSIDHDILINLIERRVNDRKFIKLIWRGLKSKTVLPSKKVVSTEYGEPLLSPLLSNIYLNELDRFMVERIKEFVKGKIRRRNPEYDRLYRREKVKDARKTSYVDPFDPNFRRMEYVRYADDFIIGIIGSRKEAEELKSELNDFLLKTLKLNLNKEKTLITRAKGNDVPFLGYHISMNSKKPYSYSRAGKTVKVLRGNRIYLKVDGRRIIRKLNEKGFCDRGGRPLPNFKYMGFPQSVTNSKISSLLRGLCNYYKLAENRRQIMSKIAYILRFSVAKLYAAKYKLRTMSKVFSRGGKDLSKSLKSGYRIVEDTLESSYQGKNKYANAEYSSSDTGNLRVSAKPLRGIIPIPYTRYTDIPKPDLKPLGNN